MKRFRQGLIEGALASGLLMAGIAGCINESEVFGKEVKLGAICQNKNWIKWDDANLTLAPIINLDKLKEKDLSEQDVEDLKRRGVIYGKVNAGFFGGKVNKDLFGKFKASWNGCGIYAVNLSKDGGEIDEILDVLLFFAKDTRQKGRDALAREVFYQDGSCTFAPRSILVERYKGKISKEQKIGAFAHYVKGNVCFITIKDGKVVCPYFFNALQSFTTDKDSDQEIHVDVKKIDRSTLSGSYWDNEIVTALEDMTKGGESLVVFEKSVFGSELDEYSCINLKNNEGKTWIFLEDQTRGRLYLVVQDEKGQSRPPFPEKIQNPASKEEVIKAAIAKELSGYVIPFGTDTSSVNSPVEEVENGIWASFPPTETVKKEKSKNEQEDDCVIEGDPYNAEGSIISKRDHDSREQGVRELVDKACEAIKNAGKAIKNAGKKAKEHLDEVIQNADRDDPINYNYGY